MKKIKEGLINEEIVRRYPGSGISLLSFVHKIIYPIIYSNNNGGNNIVDKGKGGGPRSHDYGESYC